MTHPLVAQIRFTRSEFRRGLVGISDEDARRRLMPMNSISWIIAHMTWHEQRVWITVPTGEIIAPEANEWMRHDQPASTPPLDAVWAAWEAVTARADAHLATFTPELLVTRLAVNGKPLRDSIGSMALRVVYHYWYHIGEAAAIRQMLGHTNLPDFVGAIGAEAPYTPE